MRFSASIFLAFLLLVSCQDIERTPRPDDLIAEEKMVDVLVDLSLLHGARSYNKSLMQEKGIQPYNYLWEKYKIDSTRFLKSSNYYSDHPKQYEKIFQQVKLRLESLQVKYDSIREIEEQRQDSIEAARRDSLGIKDLPERKNLNDSVLRRARDLQRMPPPQFMDDSVR